MMKETRICPICKQKYTEAPALSRKDNTEICPECGVMEALECAGIDRQSGTAISIMSQIRGHKAIRKSPYERTREQVAATGNRWAMENFNATHN